MEKLYIILRFVYADKVARGGYVYDNRLRTATSPMFLLVQLAWMRLFFSIFFRWGWKHSQYTLNFPRENDAT